MGSAEEGGQPAGGDSRPAPKLFIVSATAPVKPGEGAVNISSLQVKVDPAAEWKQMYHEIWRIERAYFYDPHYHGVNTAEEERRFEPYVDSIASRADLNYIFQEMLTGFSVGHLRGHGGAIPEAQHVPGGLLGADYKIENNRYCFAKIYTGGTWSPTVKAPLAQPGLNVHVGDCVLAINGQNVTAETNIQEPLEGTAGHAVTLHIGAANGDAARDVSVIPIPNELQLRNAEWIEANRRKVDELSGGKLAYVYLPDTGNGGFTNFNRYFMAQTNKEGVVVDERYNGGGQVADYIVEVLGRRIEGYWSPRYGAIEHTPNSAIYGPKVMIVNESAGSGGDALPWLFKYNKLGTVVGKRTWGGLVGISEIPVLMDGAEVTSPSVAFFSPKGEWDVENHGVDPDVTVEQDPKAVAGGHDPQLERAVAVALEQLKQNPPPEPHRPAYPNYHQAQ
jgi:tricorn protease